MTDPAQVHLFRLGTRMVTRMDQGAMQLAAPVYLGRPSGLAWRASPASTASRSLPATQGAMIVSLVGGHRLHSVLSRQKPTGFANLVAGTLPRTWPIATPRQ